MVVIEALDSVAGFDGFRWPRRARRCGGVVLHAEAGLSLAIWSRL